MSRKYLLDCSASGAKWADDVQRPQLQKIYLCGHCHDLIRAVFVLGFGDDHGSDQG